MRAYAVHAGVCVRPLVRRVVDTVTGDSQDVAIRCGSTREHACPSCATRARDLRITQCREGWHLVDDPLDQDLSPGETVTDDDTDDTLDASGTDADVKDRTGDRRARSTRRRDDVADLPRVPCETRTVGRTFTGRDGRTYRPSMFITLTLPSYGRVVPGRGVPVDSSSYDYRRAARDAVALSRLLDRWVQNLRRCAGYRVQYFAVVEGQRRLAGHVHLALRGAIPRAVLREVTRATYASLWWPPTDRVVYPDGGPAPVWDATSGRYLDRATRTALPTWDEALDRLDRDPAAGPWHVARWGRQVDVKGIVAPSLEADRAVRYLTKYLTKSISHTHAALTDDRGRLVETDPAMTAHVDRLADELRYTPCGPSCANWLRYGVTPKDPGPGLIPGRCPGRAHDRENAGLGGRRVLVSRHWSGKTLDEHAADRAAVVREALAAAGIDAPQADRMAAAALDEDGDPRYRWEPVEPGEADYGAAVLDLARERHRWRREYGQAKALLAAREGPPGACGQPLGNASPSRNVRAA
ncbi:MAG: replication initiator [Kineosporiaceae bacterium]